MKAAATGRPSRRLVRMEPATQDRMTLVREARGRFLVNDYFYEEQNST